MEPKKFISAFKSARQMYVSSASSIQSIVPHTTSWISVLILSPHLRLLPHSGVFTPSIPHQNPVYGIILPYTPYTLQPCYSSGFYQQRILSEHYRSLSS